VITSGRTAVTALKGSTEEAQFDEKTPDFTEAEVHHVGGAEVEHLSKRPKLVD
jgi:hypothetical protein